MTFDELARDLAAIESTGVRPTELRMSPHAVSEYVALGSAMAERSASLLIRDGATDGASYNAADDGPTGCSYNGFLIMRDSSLAAGTWHFVDASASQDAPID